MGDTLLLIGRAVIEPETLSRFKKHLIDSAISRIVEAEDGREITARGEKSTAQARDRSAGCSGPYPATMTEDQLAQARHNFARTCAISRIAVSLVPAGK